MMYSEFIEMSGKSESCKGKIWIITEADRLPTTVLFPNEY